MTSPALRVVPSYSIANIPAELRALPQWVCWRYEAGTGPKPKKVPYDPRTGALASVTDRATWAASEVADAAASAAATTYDGIGFVLCRDDPYTIIDLDDGEGNDAIARSQTRIFDAFASYSEISPSGRGLHIVVRGKVPAGRRRDRVEVYSADRYMTFTGNVYGDRHAIVDGGTTLHTLWAEMAPASAPATHDPSAFFRDATDDDATVYARAAKSANGDKFVRLWNGDGSALPGADKSGSAIDMALVNVLAFHTKDPAQIERLWRASPQGVAQGDKLDRPAYVKGTIAKAFDREMAKLDPASGALTAWGEQWQALANGSSAAPSFSPATLPAPAWPLPLPINDAE